MMSARMSLRLETRDLKWPLRSRERAWSPGPSRCGGAGVGVHCGWGHPRFGLLGALLDTDSSSWNRPWHRCGLGCLP